MELKDFVRETLKGIIDGVSEAQPYALKAIFRGQEQQVRKGSGKPPLSSRQQKGIPERMPYNIGRLRRP